VNWAKGNDPAPWDRDDAALATGAAAALAPSSRMPPGPPLSIHKVAPFRPFPDFGSRPTVRPAHENEIAAPSTPSAPTIAVPAPSEPDHPVRAIQIHNRYLIAESEEGVLVIDQHALHERILYEQLRAKVTGGNLESQSLLVPEPVDLPPAEAAAVLQKREVLERLGIRIEPFGGDTVLVSGYPAMLANLPPAEILRSVVDQLLVDGKTPEARDLVDELLHMVACKAAVKAGDRLTPEEVSALVADRHLVGDTHHCPHGRPTALVFTREELDKQFKRT
jgi:DNA mismatch repair protein MutL